MVLEDLTAVHDLHVVQSVYWVRLLAAHEGGTVSRTPCYLLEGPLAGTGVSVKVQREQRGQTVEAALELVPAPAHEVRLAALWM